MTGLERIWRAFFDWSAVRDVLPELIAVGVPNTLLLAAGGYVVAMSLGVVLALLRLSSRWYISQPVKIYVDVWRALPAILKVLLVGLGLPLAGFSPFGRSAYPYAIIAIGMIGAAYICEVLRSGIQSVERGQMEAARSVGMSHFQAMRLVIVPQGIRRVLPALMNQFVVTVKETSPVFLLGLTVDQREVFSIAQQAVHTTGSLSPMMAAGACYLIMVVPLTRLVDWIDTRLREGGMAQLTVEDEEGGPPMVGPPTAVPSVAGGA